MKTCRWFKDIEAYVDGEASRSEAVESHLAACPACASHRDGLLAWRAALRPAIETPVLSDAQFSAFMDGIRTGIEAPRHRSGGIWALVSLAAAALVIAVATFSIFTGPTPLEATQVESVSTEIDNATVRVEQPEGGVTTIWVNIKQDDILP